MKTPLPHSTQITLLLPPDTPIPVVGGIRVRTGAGWTRVSGKRWYRKKSGELEATYSLEHLRFCIGTIEASERLRPTL